MPESSGSSTSHSTSGSGVVSERCKKCSVEVPETATLCSDCYGVQQEYLEAISLERTCIKDFDRITAERERVRLAKDRGEAAGDE